MIARASVPPAPQIDAAERFLREIATRIPAELIAEIHLFPTIRQGGTESGVAVVAARNIEQRATRDESNDATSERTVVSDEHTESVDAIAASAPDDSPYADDSEPVAESPAPIAVSAPAIDRVIVYTAFYRLVLKGPDRGKWEFDTVAEADAPLEAVSTVVRGVQRRSGESNDAELLTGDAFRAAIGWQPPALEEVETIVEPELSGDPSAANEAVADA